MLRAQPTDPTSALPASLRQRLVPYGLASATALLIVTPSFYEHCWPLAWIALVPLFLALRDTSPRRAFLLGWWTETLTYWVGFYWLIGTMVRFGYIPVPISVLLFAIIGIGNGVRLGIFAWWVRRAESVTQPWWCRLLLPACSYVALDYLFPRVFPWYLGVLQLPGVPFIQVADITGVHGVTWMLVLCSTVVTACLPGTPQALRTARRPMLLTCTVLLLLQGLYGAARLVQLTTAMQQAPPLRVALIQPNIGMYEKRSGADRDAQLDLQLGLSAATLEQHPDLIIWPESMYPFGVPTHFQQLPWPVPLDTQPLHWLIGALSYAGTGSTRQVFNSALLLTSEGKILGRYDKQHLLAFGEYIPFQEIFPFLRSISPAIGNLTPGTGGILTLPGGIGLGPLICYEDIVPELARRAVQQGAHVLVNLTNDIWFGETWAPYQHRTLAAFRAVENRVYLLRVTNTGLTSVIDALGREQTALPLFQADALVHTIRPLRMPSLYTRLGDWFAWLASGGALWLSWRYRVTPQR